MMNYVENARVLQGTVDLCKVPHAKYRVKAHGTFALWCTPLVYFTAACEGGGAEGRSGTSRGQENCQKVMVAMLRPLVSNKEGFGSFAY